MYRCTCIGINRWQIMTYIVFEFHNAPCSKNACLCACVTIGYTVSLCVCVCVCVCVMAMVYSDYKH